MVSYCLLSSDEDFYATPDWAWTLQAALGPGLVPSPALTSLYSLSMTMSTWPYLASLLRTLQHETRCPYAAELAMELMNTSNTLALSPQTIDDTTITSLMVTGNISYAPPSIRKSQTTPR
jgi:hypothetical protein